MSGPSRTVLKGRARSAKIPLRMRLKAWWDGYDLIVRSLDAETGGGAGASKKAAPAAFARHGPAHIQLMQSVWGDGHVTPGGKSHILQLVKPFNLNPAMTVLDIGAGLGGTGRTVAADFGVRATCMERDAKLVKAGTELSAAAGLGRKVELRTTDLETLDIKAKSFDCIFSKEQLFTIENKSRLIEGIDGALRDQGQFLFTDYVAAKPREASSALDEWAAGEPRPVHPWTPDEYLDALRNCGLDIRISEDITDQHRRFITQGWATYLSARGGESPDPSIASALVEEVELWTRRNQALESGALQAYRFYAIRKGQTRLMSDW